jgi:hypothetical protein
MEYSDKIAALVTRSMVTELVKNKMVQNLFPF